MSESSKKYKKWIGLTSVILPLAVAGLFGVNLKKMGFDVQPLSFLPPIYAGINGLTAILLIFAFWAIKNKNIQLHQKLIKICLALSILFLLMYIAYHMTSDSTSYGGEGLIRYIYFFILITHIVLSVVIIPLVLITYVKALSKEYDKHRKIAKIAFPLWLYVAITGVVIYFMIAPYYAH